MKVQAVTLLVCAVMALSEAAALPGDKPGDKPGDGMAALIQGESQRVKRSTSCPRGWTGYNGRCFRYVPSFMTWARAERNCQNMGGNLASVHSADEYHEIQRLIVSVTHAYGEAWLGGSDAQEEGTWLWSDGSSFRYRHCGGFNNDRSQHCLQMNYGADKCWDDVWCNYRRPSVCAKTA